MMSDEETEVSGTGNKGTRPGQGWVSCMGPVAEGGPAEGGWNRRNWFQGGRGEYTIPSPVKNGERQTSVD